MYIPQHLQNSGPTPLIPVEPKMIKLYTKGERVLRGEAIVHNARALHCGHSLPNFPKSSLQWIIPIGKSRRYPPTPEGLRTIAALLTLREKVLKPLLAGARDAQAPSLPSRFAPLDDLYLAMQTEMQNLFRAPGLALQTA